MRYVKANHAARCICACVRVNWQALLWRKQYHMSARHSGGALLRRFCLQIKTDKGYPCFSLTITQRRELVCERNSYKGLQLMREIQEWNGNAWQTNNRQHKPAADFTALLHQESLNISSKFQVKMQLFTSPKKKYIHTATKSTQHSAHVSHSEPKCPLVKSNLAHIQTSFFTSFFTPLGDSRLLLIDRECRGEHVLQQNSGFWHFKTQQPPVANSNSVLSVSEAFPGSPSGSTESRALEPGNKGWQAWFGV